MRTRALLTAGAAALLVGVLPVAASAQETSNDPNDLDATFVPSAPRGTADATPQAPAPDAPDATEDAPTTDSLPNTGGGLALAGGAAVAGAALLRRRS